MIKHSVWILVGIVLFVLTPDKVHGTENNQPKMESNSYTIRYHEEGSPTGLVSTDSPEITYFIKLSNDDLPYEVDMYVNGKEVSSTYNENTGMLTYEDRGLTGANTVTVQLEVYGEKQLERSWSFEIDSRNMDPFASMDNEIVTSVGNDAIARANEYRERLDLPLLKGNDHLKEAAQAHANYMNVYSKGHHESNNSAHLFTGKQPAERTSYFGYPKWFVGEGISYEEPGGASAVDHLFDAPYHRLSLMNPFYNEVGTGYNNQGDVVMNFGGDGSEGEHRIIQYPYPNQRGVPVSWFAYETPNPLRFFNQDQVWTGYPVSYVYYGPSSHELQVSEASLVNEDGETVPSYTVTPQMENEGTHHVFLIPKEKLTPDAGYKVRVNAQAKTAEGNLFDVSRTWSFKTGASVLFNDIYFEAQNGVHFLTLEWANGEDPEAKTILSKDDKVYVEKKGDTQRTVRSLESGTYELKVDSPYFNEQETYIVKIETGNVPHYQYGSNLNVVDFYQKNTLEALYQKFPIWEARQSFYGSNKFFNDREQQSDHDEEGSFIIDRIGNLITSFLNGSEAGDSSTVLPTQEEDEESGYKPY
ncbi:CAP domain-containing protein [Pontibacillus salipaludis]|uniref:CAP domain-containing protein n=1 Tax=Pontibacillus salipaludis TaxID=1697394 RepID=UPI0031E9EE8C